jgi:hypothetical protein
VPKVQRWRGRMGAIISALEQTEAAVLDRSDVEELFKGPTAASTPADGTRRATEEAGESRVDRGRPLKGLQRERRTSGPGRCAMLCDRPSRKGGRETHNTEAAESRSTRAPFTAVLQGLRCHPQTCMLLKVRLVDSSSPNQSLLLGAARGSACNTIVHPSKPDICRRQPQPFVAFPSVPAQNIIFLCGFFVGLISKCRHILLILHDLLIGGDFRTLSFPCPAFRAANGG